MIHLVSKLLLPKLFSNFYVKIIGSVLPETNIGCVPKLQGRFCVRVAMLIGIAATMKKASLNLAKNTCYTSINMFLLQLSIFLFEWW